MIFPRCIKDNSTDCNNTLCTTEFRSVVILIKNSSDNSPVVLTSYKVILTSNNLDITTYDSNLGDNNGYYIVATDATSGLKRNSNNEVEFQGFINNTLVIQKQFVINRDCCHITLVSGDTEAYI